MNERYKDTDLREALRRKYADVPELPADFMASMNERLQAKPVAKTRRLWSWVAAACVAALSPEGELLTGETARMTTASSADSASRFCQWAKSQPSRAMSRVTIPVKKPAFRAAEEGPSRNSSTSESVRAKNTMERTAHTFDGRR